MVRLTPEQVAWLLPIYAEHTLTATTALFNARYGTAYSANTLKACFPAHGIRSSRRPGLPPGHPRAWTAAQVAWIQAHRADYRIGALTDAFNAAFGLTRSRSQVQSACERYLIPALYSARFQEGVVPWNKGLKTGRRSDTAAKTGNQFGPGNMPTNWVPIGTRQQRHGTWFRKVSEGHGPGLSRYGWKEEHRMLWEEAHGPQPPHTAVVFLDGNPDNLHLDNLLLVTRAELCKLNQLGWRQVQDPAGRLALVAQVRLLVTAHRLAREAGIGLWERRKLLPNAHKIKRADVS